MRNAAIAINPTTLKIILRRNLSGCIRILLTTAGESYESAKRPQAHFSNKGFPTRQAEDR